MPGSDMRRLVKALAKLKQEFAVVICRPNQRSGQLLASTGAAEWLKWVDAGNTFWASLHKSQLDRRVLAVKLECGGVDCSLPALDKKLQGQMLTALVDALVDRQQFPYASTSTEQFKQVC